MNAFSRAWRLEADTIYCRCCKRGVVRSRDTGTFQHRAGCTNKASHPWAVLSAIISTPIATAPKESRIYLSGPMTGLPDLNFPAFHAEAARLRGLGYDVVNPAELVTDKEADWVDCMRVDIPALLTCGTIALLPGWVDSRGASLEAYIAEKLGMGFFTAADRIAFPVSSKPCAGNNCRATDGVSHSPECQAEQLAVWGEA